MAMARKSPYAAYLVPLSVVVAFLSACCTVSSNSFTTMLKWAFAQWMPLGLALPMQSEAWGWWQQEEKPKDNLVNNRAIQTVDVQRHKADLTGFLEATYGKGWRRRPLLLEGLWDPIDLAQNTSRRLSLDGLLKEDLTIPYFTDARVKGALTPDASAPVQQVVASIQAGAPSKIGSQLLVQTFPELVNEVAPVQIVQELFGDYFTPERVRGTGPFNLLPALTTVPLFVANMRQESSATADKEDESKSHPYTGLHCEPIGNVAVQLSGQKKWTLVDPQHWRMLKPSLSPDNRAFFASWADNYAHVPTYTAITSAGDAIWVPTWTWHRIDYIPSDSIAIGASLFHFRPLDYMINNPLFAFLVIPALLLELVGHNTQ